MKYTLENNTLAVTAESKLEAFFVLDHFGALRRVQGGTEAELDASVEQVMSQLAQVSTGRLVHLSQGSEKRAWFRCQATLPDKAIKPYLDLLKKVTGFEGVVPQLEFRYRNYGLFHTHVVDKCYFSSDGIEATGYIQSQDWAGKLAKDRAPLHFAEYITEDFGFRKHEPEYVRAGGGMMLKNPHYLVRHPPEPGLGSPELWAALFTWWRSTHATPKQEAVLQQAEALAKKDRFDNSWAIRKGGGDQAGLVDHAGIRVSYSELPGIVSWAEFQGKAEVAPEDSWFR